MLAGAASALSTFFAEKRPMTSFNFDVYILVGHALPILAGFSECTGPMMSSEPKSVYEGANNARPYHLPGKLSYNTITLKRGVTDSRSLWLWFYAAVNSVAVAGVRLPSDVIIQMNSADRSETVRYLLLYAQPVRIKAPDMNATQGSVAIEEIDLKYEMLFRL